MTPNAYRENAITTAEAVLAFLRDNPGFYPAAEIARRVDLPTGSTKKALIRLRKLKKVRDRIRVRSGRATVEVSL